MTEWPTLPRTAHERETGTATVGNPSPRQTAAVRDAIGVLGLSLYRENCRHDFDTAERTERVLLELADAFGLNPRDDDD